MWITDFLLNSTWELESIFNKQPRLRKSSPTKSPTPRPYSGRGKKSKSWKQQRPVVIPATHGVELLSNLGKIWWVSTWFFFEKDEISQQGYVSTHVFFYPQNGIISFLWAKGCVLILKDSQVRKYPYGHTVDGNTRAPLVMPETVLQLV